MKKRIQILAARSVLLALTSAFSLHPSSLVLAAPLGTAFTYQGRLHDGTQPATGIYDFIFIAHDAATAGAVVGGPVTNAATGVTNGLFTVSLDFGPGVFAGNARWLGISVRTNGSGGYVALAPRQPITAAPQALYAPNAGQASGAGVANSVIAGGVNGTALAANSVDGGKILDGSVTEADLSGAVRSNTFWRLGGNSGTTPGAQFLGTTDNQPFEFKANGQRALRLEPGTGGLPNIIGGAAVNTVDPGIFGAVIGGGGAPAWPHRVAANNGTIAGGIGHEINSGANQAAIGGGAFNVIESSAADTVIGGGHGNRIQSSAVYSAVGGGLNNTNGPNAIGATIPGGRDNYAGGLASFAAGRRAKALNPGAFVWADYTDADFASTGQNQFLIRAGGGVGIGTNNPQAVLHVAGTVMATNFVGSGAGLTNLSVAALTGTLPDARLSTNVALLNSSPRFSGTVAAGGFSGNGGGLSNLSLAAVGPAGTFSLSAFTLVGTPSVGSDPQSVTAVDVNGDGKSDLVSANYYGYDLSVLTNNGSGEFLLSASLGVGAYVTPIFVAAADVNGDARADLISAIWNTNLVIIWTNSGTGGFVSNATIHVGQWPRCVVAADLSGDGRPELITANCFDDSLTILTNNGSGIFGSNATLQVGDYPFHLAAVDVNGDGKRDLVAANWFGYSLTVLTNNGSGVFGSNATLTVGSSPAWVEAVDVTGDGRPDLISANQNGSSLTVLTNNGSGRFALSATLVTEWNPSGIASADLTGDGRLDLVCANHGSDSLTVLTNNGSGVFGSHETIQVGRWPASVVAADLNGDGRPDLVSANEVDNSLSILLAKPAVSLLGALYLERLSVSNAAHFATNVEFAGGFDAYGELVLHDHDLLLRDDKFHGLGWYGAGKPFAGASPDGPVLYGYSGGQLATKSHSATNVALSWNSAGQVGINTNNPQGAALNVAGIVRASAFQGDGAGLTGVSVSGNNISSGTINDARLSANVALRSGGNTFSGAQVISSGSLRMSDEELFFRGGSDAAHGVGYYGATSTFAGINVDGPVLYGWTGGGLGSMNGGQHLALQWDNTGNIATDSGNFNAGSLAPGLVFGGLGSGEGISSKRTTGANQFSLNFHTGFSNRMTILATGDIGIGTLSPTRRLHIMDGSGATHAGGSIQVGMATTGGDPKLVYFGDGDWVHIGENGSDDTMELKASRFFFTGGNLGIGTNNPAYKVHLADGAYCNGTQWVNASDRDAKTGFSKIDSQAVLDKVAALPVASWRYRSEPETTRHIGPTAQDFRAAFGLGDSDKAIGTVDADGVALAAIQGLNQKLEETRAELKRRDVANAELKARLEKLERLMNHQSEGVR